LYELADLSIGATQKPQKATWHSSAITELVTKSAVWCSSK